MISFQTIWIHSQTHRAPSPAPFEPGVTKQLVQPFALSSHLHCLRPRHYQSLDVRSYAVPFRNQGRLAQI